MPYELNEEKVKAIFSQALESVADVFDPEDEAFLDFTFDKFEDFHKLVFLNRLKYLFLEERFNQGGVKFCFDVALNENMFTEWENFRGCINYLHMNQYYVNVADKIPEF